MSQTSANVYSQQWFTSFHIPIDDVRTNREVDFICSYVPLPRFRRIADICCGIGRHARSLSKRGYLVTGVDRDASMIARARELAGGPNYIEADLRAYQPDSDAYDAVVVMGQSFGHFDHATNREVLGRLSSGIRHGGRLILDLWNPEFFNSHQGDRDLDVLEGVVRETKRVEHGRLFVQLTYPDGDQEAFEWQLLSRADIESLIAPLGLILIASSTDFDHSAETGASKARLQFVLQRYKHDL